MAAADFLDETRMEIAARLKELKPLVDEYRRPEAAAAALDGISATPLTHATPATRRAPARTTAATPTRGATHGGRRGRPNGSGTRGAEALALVKQNPGITIPEIAEKMGIKQNYLYRVLPGLAADGLVVKDGRGGSPRTPHNNPQSPSAAIRDTRRVVGERPSPTPGANAALRSAARPLRPEGPPCDHGSERASTRKRNAAAPASLPSRIEGAARC
jgi:hypothetical protein